MLRRMPVDLFKNSEIYGRIFDMNCGLEIYKHKLDRNLNLENQSFKFPGDDGWIDRLRAINFIGCDKNQSPRILNLSHSSITVDTSLNLFFLSVRRELSLTLSWYQNYPEQIYEFSDLGMSPCFTGYLVY